jgi:predicted aldo/keto reductase-like oxidoreductase
MTANLFRDYTQLLKEKHATEASQIKSRMNEICPELTSSLTLSQKTLRTIYSSGVDCTLVGMKNREQVQDCLSLGPRISADSVSKILQSAKWDPIHFIEGDPNE